MENVNSPFFLAVVTVIGSWAESLCSENKILKSYDFLKENRDVAKLVNNIVADDAGLTKPAIFLEKDRLRNIDNRKCP